MAIQGPTLANFWIILNGHSVVLAVGEKDWAGMAILDHSQSFLELSWMAMSVCNLMKMAMKDDPWIEQAFSMWPWLPRISWIVAIQEMYCKLEFIHEWPLRVTHKKDERFSWMAILALNLPDNGHSEIFTKCIQGFPEWPLLGEFFINSVQCWPFRKLHMISMNIPLWPSWLVIQCEWPLRMMHRIIEEFPGWPSRFLAATLSFVMAIHEIPKFCLNVPHWPFKDIHCYLINLLWVAIQETPIGCCELSWIAIDNKLASEYGHSGTAT